MIRVYAVGGRRLTVLPHTPEAAIRSQALELGREESVPVVLVIDRHPCGQETVVEEITSVAAATEPEGEEPRVPA